MTLVETETTQSFGATSGGLGAALYCYHENQISMVYLSSPHGLEVAKWNERETLTGLSMACSPDCCCLDW